MKENILEVLIYLFENFMEEGTDGEPDQGRMESELISAGFTDSEINKAFAWLEGLDQRREAGLLPLQTDQSIRIYTEREMRRLDSECRGFLLYLEQMGVLVPTARELVIDRVMALEGSEFTLDQLKWVVLLVLFNQPGQEEAYTWMEDLIFNTIIGHVH
jgi:Smg protein